MMKTSARGRSTLALREGVRLKAYYDSVGVLTIGVGHTSKAGPPTVTPGLIITQAECDAIFAHDLVQYENAVNDAVKVPVSQSSFDAMVSFCFNVGPASFARSTIVKRLNAGDVTGAADAFLLWNKPPEIMGRRRSERTQFLAADPKIVAQPPAPDIEPPKPVAPKPKSNTGPIVGTVAGTTAGAAAAHKAGLTPLQVGLVALVVIALVIGGVVLWRTNVRQSPMVRADPARAGRRLHRHPHQAREAAVSGVLWRRVARQLDCVARRFRSWVAGSWRGS
jgi:lysozyme